MFKTISCQKCGNDIQANHLYCRSCGTIPMQENQHDDHGQEHQRIHPSTISTSTDPTLQYPSPTTSKTNSVLDSVLGATPVLSNMTMERGDETNYDTTRTSTTQTTIVNSDKTFALITKDLKTKVIESYYCCLPCPMMPCFICLCSGLEVVNASQNGEPITVHYNHETRTLRNMNRHRQFIVTEWDKSTLGTPMTSFGCFLCPCCVDNNKWNLMSDGSLVYVRGDNVAFGKVDDPNSTGDAPILVNANSFSTMKFNFDG